jgi:hypothetical protein
MSAATFPIDTPSRPGHSVSLPVYTNTNIYAGTLVALNATGYAVPASDTAALVVVGRAEFDALNNPGASGAINVTVGIGCYRFTNDVTNPVTATQVGQQVFVLDNQTVTAVSNNWIPAGVMLGIEADDETGVWVDTSRATPAIGALTAGVLVQTSAANGTDAAVDLATSEALANALKATVNAIVTDITTIFAALNALARL